MGETSRIIRYLCYDEIVDINRQIILTTGGFVNAAGKVNNPGSLHYLVDIVQEKINNVSLYPTLSHKAAIYAYNIITRHVFLDGNKRTGMFCAFYFLKINNYNLPESISNDEIIEIALGVANGTKGLNDLTMWLKEC